jgi:N-acetylmuramoyl-L-alanine amidase
MEDPVNPPSQPNSYSIINGLKQIPMVFGVAFLIASLFTIWNPGQSTEKPEVGQPITQIIQPTKIISSQVPNSTQDVASDKIRVGIVAGHWGHDSGATCQDGFTEANINLQVASIVQKLLNEQGIVVDLLKEFDPALYGYNATALVSIHADSCDFINNEASGFKVAASLNNPHPERAARLTSCLRSRYTNATGLPVHSQSVTIDMTSYHAFGEIDENTTASIIEIGFLNLDREYLTQNTDQVAYGIVSGILCFINNESVNLQPTPTQP